MNNFFDISQTVMLQTMTHPKQQSITLNKGDSAASQTMV